MVPSQTKKHTHCCSNEFSYAVWLYEKVRLPHFSVTLWGVLLEHNEIPSNDEISLRLREHFKWEIWLLSN